LLQPSAPPRALHSFPTRRSSDLPCVPEITNSAQRRSRASSAPKLSPDLAQCLDQPLLLPFEADADPKMVAQRRRVEISHENPERDRKSTRLNSSHVSISYAVFCL